MATFFDSLPFLLGLGLIAALGAALFSIERSCRHMVTVLDQLKHSHVVLRDDLKTIRQDQSEAASAHLYGFEHVDEIALKGLFGDFNNQGREIITVTPSRTDPNKLVVVWRQRTEDKPPLNPPPPKQLTSRQSRPMRQFRPGLHRRHSKY